MDSTIIGLNSQNKNQRESIGFDVVVYHHLKAVIEANFDGRIPLVEELTGSARQWLLESVFSEYSGEYDDIWSDWLLPMMSEFYELAQSNPQMYDPSAFSGDPTAIWPDLGD